MLATDYDKSKLEHLPKIIIEVVDHNDQKYETVGNYFGNSDGSWTIQVSRTNIKYEFLVAVHELIEKVLCHCKGISDDDITSFDEVFEEMRRDYPTIVGEKEPGDEDAAPYLHEHKMASRVERWLADSFLGANPQEEWGKYEKTITSLKQF